MLVSFQLTAIIRTYWHFAIIIGKDRAKWYICQLLNGGQQLISFREKTDAVN